MSILREIIDLKNSTTYQVGLLQTKAYRNLKRKTGEALKSYDITTVEWAFLGLLYDTPKGIRSNDLANILGVEAPFITSLTPKLEALGILEYKKDEKDKRAKNIFLTSKGQNLVKKIEHDLRAKSKVWMKGLSVNEVLTFIRVLKKLSED